MTQYTINVGLGYWQLDDLNWHIPFQASMQLLDSLGPIKALAVRMREIPSTSLFVSVAAGYFRNMAGTYTPFAGATIALTASTTQKIWLDNTGALITGTAWPSTGHVRLATVVVGASLISSVTDERVAFGASIGSG
jgi:hypothetical protein